MEQVPIVTFCRHNPFIGIDCEKLKVDFNVSTELIQFIILGSGFLMPSPCCFRPHILNTLPFVQDWSNYTHDYEKLLEQTLENKFH